MIDRISCRIPSRRNPIRLARSQVTCRNLLLLLQMQGRFDHCRGQPGLDVKLDVAVEEVDTRVSGSEAKDKVVILVDLDRVAAHGDARELGAVAVVCDGRFGLHVGGAGDDLELVAVEMERMAAVVEVVQTDFNNRVVIKDIGVGVDAVDYRVASVTASAQGCVERWHLLLDVRDVIYYSSVKESWLELLNSTG